MLFGRIKNVALAGSLFILTSTGWAQRGPGARTGAGRPAEAGTCQTLINSLPLQPLDAAEAEGILYMREEEKLARDVYARLYADWGAAVFANISRSEQQHMDALARILDRYGLADPAAGNGAGIFSNPGLQALYGDLVRMGTSSLEAALRAGATVEDLDIRDLDQAIAGTDNEDLKAVYGNLQRGSRNHLRAFAAQLGALGEAYTAQYITPEALAQILTGTPETGNGWGRRGNGPMGYGRGNGTCPQGNAPAGEGTRRPW